MSAEAGLRRISALPGATPAGYGGAENYFAAIQPSETKKASVRASVSL